MRGLGYRSLHASMQLSSRVVFDQSHHREAQDRHACAPL